MGKGGKKGQKGQKGQKEKPSTSEQADASEAMGALSLATPDPTEEETEEKTLSSKERRQKKKEARAKLNLELKQAKAQKEEAASPSTPSDVASPSTASDVASPPTSSVALTEPSTSAAALAETTTPPVTAAGIDISITSPEESEELVSKARRTRRRKPKSQAAKIDEGDQTVEKPASVPSSPGQVPSVATTPSTGEPSPPWVAQSPLPAERSPFPPLGGAWVARARTPSPQQLQSSPPGSQLQPSPPGSQLRPSPPGSQLRPSPPGLQLQPRTPPKQQQHLQPCSPGSPLQLQPRTPPKQQQHLQPCSPGSQVQLQPSSPGSQLRPSPPGSQLRPSPPGSQLRPSPPGSQQPPRAAGSPPQKQPRFSSPGSQVQLQPSSPGSQVQLQPSAPFPQQQKQRQSRPPFSQQHQLQMPGSTSIPQQQQIEPRSPDSQQQDVQLSSPSAQPQQRQKSPFSPQQQPLGGQSPKKMDTSPVQSAWVTSPQKIDTSPVQPAWGISPPTGDVTSVTPWGPRDISSRQPSWARSPKDDAQRGVKRGPSQHEVMPGGSRPRHDIQEAGPSGYQYPQQQQQKQTRRLSGEATKKLSSVASSLYSIPAKIVGPPVPGKQTKVLSNYLPLKVKNMKVQRYDVTVTPDKPKKFMNLVFTTMLKKYFPKSAVAYDQNKLAFATEKLPGISTGEKPSFKVDIKDDNDRELNFDIQLKEAGVVDFSTLFAYMQNGTSMSPPTEAVQCIDVILRQGVLEKYVKAGRTFFTRPDNPFDLSDGLEMWTGIFQSAIFASKPYINIDVVHKGFPKQQPLVDVLRVFNFDLSQPLKSQPRGNMHGLMHFLKGIRLTANIGGDVSKKGVRREFPFLEIVDAPYKLTFKQKEGDTEKNVSVAEYFLRDKNCRLKYPNLNCVWVGSRDKSIYYPIELLEVPYGFVSNKQMNERQVSNMVREAATPPSHRKEKIHHIIEKMNYRTNPLFAKFGLEISTNLTEVPAKVLAAPSIEYYNQLVQPKNGAWSYYRLLKSAQLVRWGIIAINIDARAANAEAGIKMLQSCAAEVGIQMGNCTFSRYNVPMTHLEAAMRDAQEKGLQLLFVVFPVRGMKEAYCQVKQCAERRVGILTQCIKDNTMNRINKNTAKNILLKVNSKLMGINQAIDPKCLPKCLQGGKVMVVGADVTHPSPDQTAVPSIAAVTASIDAKCFIYNIGLSVQTSKQEMILEFEDMMLEHLRVYKARLNHLPEKIYVFRDGVSEGQFAHVMQNELRAIYQAYATLTGGTGRPQVLFMLVQKRHHTRFFTCDKIAQNVEPGTVVDKEIVHPRELDFYLVSHHAIKGTARPTRYHAVCNDSGLGAEEVEQLAFYLCHLYSRCARSVSYPTPTYYAHLACLRARVLTYGERYDSSKETKRLRVLEKMLSDSRMFFV